MAFKIAASMALKECKSKANPIILEPIMDVEVVSPNEYVGNVIGDLTSRRGRLESQEGRGNAVSIRALVPLSEMFGYATSLRSNTQGRCGTGPQRQPAVNTREKRTRGGIAGEPMTRDSGCVQRKRAPKRAASNRQVRA